MPPKARPDLGSHKRARVDISAVGGAAPGDLPSPIDARFFSSKMTASCKRDFQSAKPFPHLRLSNFCAEDRMRGIREEITGCALTFQNTSLFPFQNTSPPAPHLIQTLCLHCRHIHWHTNGVSQAGCTPSSKKRTYTRLAAAAHRAKRENINLKSCLPGEPNGGPHRHRRSSRQAARGAAAAVQPEVRGHVT